MAIAFSGALRTDENFENFKKFFIDKKYQVDYFLYTTDKIDMLKSAFGRAKTINPDYKTSENLTKERVNKFLKCFNPVRVLIEPLEKFVKDLKKESKRFKFTENEYKVISYEDFVKISQMAKAEKVINLVSQYEKENQFEYDVILRVRPDVFIDLQVIPSLRNRVDEIHLMKLLLYKIEESYVPTELPIIYLEFRTGVGSIQDKDWYVYGSSQAVKLYYNNLTFSILEMQKKSFRLIYKLFGYDEVKDMGYWELHNFILNNTGINIEGYDSSYQNKKYPVTMDSFDCLLLRTFFSHGECMWPVGSYKVALESNFVSFPFDILRPGFLERIDTFMPHDEIDLDRKTYEKALLNGDIEKYNSEIAIGHLEI
jgi:hypothetical protein